MSDAHQLDKATALLKSLAADHCRGDGTDHEWRTCRACLASEELGYAKAGELSSPAQRLLRLLITELDELRALRARHAELEAEHDELGKWRRGLLMDAGTVAKLERHAEAVEQAAREFYRLGHDHARYGNVLDEELLTVGQVARLCDPPVSGQIVRVWANEGRLPVTRMATGFRLFRRSDVLHFLADRAAKAAARVARKDVARG